MLKNLCLRVVFGFLAVLWVIGSTDAEEIPLVKQGGVYTLPVVLNGVMYLDFILDSGASEVVIPAEVALSLLRSGTVQESDFLPGKTYVLADGSKLESPRLVVRSIELGRHKLTDVHAAVGPAGSALLLGQNCLERLGVWSLDSRRQVLVIENSQEHKPKPSRKKTSPLPVLLTESLHGSLPDDWQILKEQASHFIKSGEYSKAEPYLEKALKTQEEVLGVKDTRIPDTVSTLIEVYEKQNKRKEAESLNDWAASVWGQ